MKTLIAFFSRAGENFFDGECRSVEVGNTEIAVNHIKELIEADVFKIEMIRPYSDNYDLCADEAKQDKNYNERPAVAHPLKSIAQYDTIILAYPNYWGTFPMVVATFLEGFDWTNKTILPLCTNEDTGMGESERDIALCTRGVVPKLGLSVHGSSVKEAKPAIEAWLKENGVI